jgi:GTP-binding nuclear protein Ran
MSQSDTSLKMVFVGDCGVGKTTLIHRLNTGEFKKEYKSNFQTLLTCIPFETNKGKKVIVVNDCSGQENVWFRDINICGADVVVVMFDVTCQSSFDNVEKWYKSSMKYAPNALYIICGNKVDKEDRVVKPKDICFHITHNLFYYDVSARSNYNIEKLFLNALRYKFG